ncbi:MAG TPA: twin-arginine translocation signal domain-containing protein [Pyrinomonadaceae bacterium]
MVKYSRREFLTTISVAGGAVAIGGLVPSWLRHIGRPEATIAADFKARMDFALGKAKALGCAYADMEIKRWRNGYISRRAGSGPNGTISVLPEIESERLTFGVGVVHTGGWGYAEGSTLTKDEIIQTTARAVTMARANAVLADGPATIIPRSTRTDRWATPHDPFDRPLDDQLASLVAPNNHSAKTFAAEETFFVSSKGAFDHSAKLSVA